MEVQIAVAKVKKYATSESGDTLEVVERPNGGLSVVLADGQSSGRGAKRISNMVVRKVISLLAEGVRDGAAARAASDYLFTERQGKVQATLNILSADMQTRTLVVTRNNPAPVLVLSGGRLLHLDGESVPVGIYRGTRPVVTELPLEEGMTVIMFTDGVVHAGARYGQHLDLETLLHGLYGDTEEEDTHQTPPSAEDIAEALLSEALRLDRGRPTDDISIVVLQVVPYHEEPRVRRMLVRLPL
ncbi:MAG: serine/threonine-protein phosphatase [Chloroflexi bacterium]|nr:serine/threonine-protein phosphatase [Chloroflexota bacterium]